MTKKPVTPLPAPQDPQPDLRSPKPLFSRRFACRYEVKTVVNILPPAMGEMSPDDLESMRVSKLVM